LANLAELNLAPDLQRFTEDEGRGHRQDRLHEAYKFASITGTNQHTKLMNIDGTQSQKKQEREMGGLSSSP
jgi:hypothetical protein